MTLNENEQELINTLLHLVPKEVMRDLMNMKRKNKKQEFMDILNKLADDKIEIKLALLRYSKRKHGQLK